MSDVAIDKVFRLEEVMADLPQVGIVTWHVLHGGMYARTIQIPAGTALTGALVKVPTILTVNGDVTVFANDVEMRMTGYNVIPASAGRKQAFIAHADTDLTMVFTTEVDNISDAEEQFTDQAVQLMSRAEEAVNYVTITGE